MFSCKKFFITMLSAALVICNTPDVIYAQAANNDISLYYDIVRQAEASLDINGGNAEITIKITSSLSTYQINIAYSIQKFADGKWKAVKTWNKNIDNSLATITNSYNLPSKGKYRIKCNAKVQDKDKTEEIIFFSAEKTY
ncbi:MAG: hypothetical protein HFH68_14160 [Lachnospiraceae bacterium]|nr:hypothetical protein [Lachnospiraceae bacterium]